MNPLRHLTATVGVRALARLSALLLLTVLPAAAGPILSPSTTTVGGIVSGANFVTGVDGGSPSANQWPAAEDPSKVVNGIIGGSDKYLNFAVTNTAVIFRGTTRRAADRLQLWVANDSPQRDPASYILYGTNATIPALSPAQIVPLSTYSFTQISSGNLSLPAERNTTAGTTVFSQTILFPNSTAFASYLLVFPTVKGPAANAMQISEVQLYDSGVIGVEQFDYADGPIADKNGGTFWNYKNIAPIGPAGAASDWDVAATPTVTAGRLVTQDSSAKREYNGPGGGFPPSDEANGAVNNDNVNKSVYYRVTVTTGATVPTWFGLSSYDFGTERLFFGKSTGQAKFGIVESGGSGTNSTNTADILANTTYTLVVRLNYATDSLALWVFPGANAPPNASEESQLPAVLRSYTGTNWSTAVRLASSGGSPVTWDDLVVATSWDDLGTVVDTATDEDHGNLLGSVSLREAAKYSPTGSLITFASNLSGGTIPLGGTQFTVDRSLTIDATALPGGLTLDGNNATRHFYVEPDKSLTLRGLTLTGGNGTGTGANNNRGGAINSFSGNLTLTQCTFYGNTASNEGGAVFKAGGTMTMTHCTLSGNSAQSGGAISNVAGTMTVTHGTLSGNIASNNGGGISNNGPLTLTNTIAAGNHAPTGPDVFQFPSGAILRAGVNLIGNLSGFNLTASDTILTGDAKLSPLGYFGGPVQTLHPLIGSPAIDAAGSTDPGGTDARGFPRFVDGNASGAEQLDIGAVEAGPITIVSNEVDNLAPTTLRTRINNAAGIPGARIGFLPAAFPANTTITLGGTQLDIPATPGLFIDASNLSAPVTLSGNSTTPSRVFNVPATATVAMHSVKIINGKAPDGVNDFSGEIGENGGGILNGGSLSLFSCTLSGNSAGNGGFGDITGGGGGGGGGISSSGSLSLSSCTLSGNSAGNGGFGNGDGGGGGGGGGGAGGGIFSSGSLSLLSCTLSGNSAGNGGGGGNGNGGGGGFGGGVRSTGSLRLTACTLSGNASGGGGSGNGVGGGIFGNAILQNCLIARNTQGSSTTLDEVRAITVTYLGTNLLGTAAIVTSSTGTPPTINANPLLAPLGDYGGPTWTMPPLPGSPAIDAAGPLSEVQRFDLGAFQGNFTLSFKGASTGSLSWSTVTAATLQTSFGSLSTIGGANVAVEIFDTGNSNKAFTVRFISALAGADQPALVGAPAAAPGIIPTVTTVQDGAPGSLLLTDQRGFPRPRDGDGDGIAAPDIGAVEASFIAVINSNNEGPGSLRQAVLDAAAQPGADTINFTPAVTGPITLATQIVLADASPVTIDATTRPGGVTVSGGTTTRHFQVDAGKNLTLRGLTLTGGNGSGGEGGSVLNGGTLALDRCILTGNASNSGSGGAVRSFGLLTAVDSTFSNNTAEFSGGGISTFNGTTVLDRCTLAWNTAGSGGGISSRTSSISGPITTGTTLTHCTLAGNSASQRGGGLDNPIGRTTLTHCTLSGNTAPAGLGSGVASFGNNATETVVKNTVISGNTGSSVDFVGTNATINSFTSQGGNLIGSGNATGDFPQPGDVLNDTPKLTPLGSYGGPVQTMHPLIGSPAIDAIVTPDPGGTDARGFPRYVDGDNASPGIQLDIGAVEAGQLLTVTTAVDENDGPAGLGTSLRDALGFSNGVGRRIRFSTSQFPATITLAQALGELTIPATPGLFIDASDLSAPVTISGNNRSRVFNIPATATVAMHSVRIVGGITGSAGGGGILNAGTCTVISSTLSENVATFATGGGISNSGACSVIFSTLSGNRADGHGGGIHNTGICSVQSSTFSGNSANSGGGGIFNSGTCTVISSTLSDNTGQSGGGGGGILNSGSAASFILGSSIVAGNVGLNVAGPLSNTNNLTTGDPLLAPLGDYGGPTQTMALRPGSPARNTGTPNTGRLTDQRGYPIIGLPDIGAYEAGNALLTNYNAYIWETLPATATEPQHAPTFDFDFDGSGNEEEFLAGTAAGDPNSIFRPTASRNGAGDFVITFPTITGRTYRFQTSDSLSDGSWITDISSARAGNGSDQSYSIPTTSITRRFFRVISSP